MEKEVGGFDGLARIVAANPEEAGQDFVREGSWVKGVGTVDESDPFAIFAGAFEDGSDEEGGAAGDAGADDFGDCALGQAAIEERIEARQAGGETVGDGFRTFGGHSDAGKFFREKLAQLDDISGV